ncbi:MAG: DMT family transporter [Synergistaceae bacterium]|jgi:drug/metabolite transporter (DMT)-like permease|nr:DMT family transporter [Synergistaceae bacterium]
MPVWGFLLSFFIAFLWAISPVLMKEGLKSCSPSEVPAIRSAAFVVGMSIIMLYAQPGRMPYLTPKLLMYAFASVGLSTFLGDLLYTQSINLIGASLAVSVSSAYPLVVTCFSILILGERITSLVWAGTILVIAGLAVIEIEASRAVRMKQAPNYGLVDIAERSKARRNLAKGVSLALFAALCWGINMPLIKLTMDAGGWTPIENYFVRSVTFFILAWGMRWIQQRKFPNTIRPIEKISFKSLMALILSALLALVLGGILYGSCIANLPVSVVTPITASSPFITAILSRIAFKERMSLIQSAGASLVVVGSIAVSL